MHVRQDEDVQAGPRQRTLQHRLVRPRRYHVRDLGLPRDEDRHIRQRQDDPRGPKRCREGLHRRFQVMVGKMVTCFRWLKRV